MATTFTTCLVQNTLHLDMMYLFFVPSIQSGGTESVVFRYCKQLIPAHSVHIFSIVQDLRFSHLPTSFAFESVNCPLYRFLSLPPLRPFFYLYITVVFLFKLSLLPRYVLCFGDLPILLASPFALFCFLFRRVIPTPYFVSSFRNDPSTLNFVKTQIFALLSSCFDLSTTNSLSAARLFNRSPFSFSYVSCLYNPLPSHPPLNASSVKEKSKSLFKLLSVSRLVPQKNVCEMITLMSTLKKNLAMPISLIVVGDGPELVPLHRLSQQLDVDDCVEFLGSLDYLSISSLMQECHALLHFSLWDGIPNTVLEALVHSLPVFAYESPHSSLSDLKGFSAPIYFFDSFDPDSLLIEFRAFLRDSVLDSDYNTRSSDFVRSYSSSTCLQSFITFAQALNSV